MATARKIVWVATIVAGTLAGTVGADVVASDRLALGLVFGGFGLAFGAVFVGTRFHFGRSEDERIETIWYRAGFYGWLSMLAAGTALGSALNHQPDLLSGVYAVGAVQATGILSVVAAAAYFERTM